MFDDWPLYQIGFGIDILRTRIFFGILENHFSKRKRVKEYTNNDGATLGQEGQWPP